MNSWNNGTIFRVYVLGTNASIVNGTLTTKVEIDQQLLTGKVFIGVENMILKPVVNTNATQDYWATQSYLQLQSINLPPYIDYSTFPEIVARSDNTKIFARVPLQAIPVLANSAAGVESRFCFSQVLNKNSIMYEMLNNPNALSNGRLTIRFLNSAGQAVPDGYINNVIFTLVIYKANDGYV